jgi:hypothetical protein
MRGEVQAAARYSAGQAAHGSGLRHRRLREMPNGAQADRLRKPTLSDWAVSGNPTPSEAHLAAASATLPVTRIT